MFLNTVLYNQQAERGGMAIVNSGKLLAHTIDSNPRK